MKKNRREKTRLVLSIVVCTVFIGIAFGGTAGETPDGSETVAAGETAYSSEVVVGDEGDLEALWPQLCCIDKDWNYWGNKPHMFAIPSGNVGIGTNSPNHLLHLDTSSDDIAIQFGSGTGWGNPGPKYPAVGENDASVGDVAWNSPDAVTASDDNRAYIYLSPDTRSYYLKATDFDFAIPLGAEIVGIEVEWERYRDSGGLRDNCVRIVKNGIIGSTDRSASGFWSGAESFVSYGGDSDLWGETWSPADINSPSFGAALSVWAVPPQLGIACVDSVRITVYYANPVWTLGMDRSDSDMFKISAADSLGGVSDVVSIDGFSGNVGIGTASPVSLLTLKSSAPDASGGIRLVEHSGDDTPVLIYEKAAGEGAIILRDDGSNHVLLQANGASYITGGNVGIGTSGPAYNLDVSGNIRATGTLYGDLSGTADNADMTDSNHIEAVSVSTLGGTYYVADTQWADIYANGYNTLRIYNPTGYTIRYCYSKNFGTPVEGTLAIGEYHDITGLYTGSIDIRVSEISPFDHQITFFGMGMGTYWIDGHVIYSDYA